MKLRNKVTGVSGQRLHLGQPQGEKALASFNSRKSPLPPGQYSSTVASALGVGSDPRVEKMLDHLFDPQLGRLPGSMTTAGMSAGELMLDQKGPRYEVTGSLGMPSVPVQMSTGWSSEYQYMMTGLLPADPMVSDSSALSLFYRDIYQFDHVAGSLVDILSTFPWSNFTIRGLPKKQLEFFKEAVDRLSIQRMLPEISLAYLVDGYFCGSLIYSQRDRGFVGTMVHDALATSVGHSPFFGVDPEITVRVATAVKNFSQGSEYNKHYIKSLPQEFQALLNRGTFVCNPVNTLFVPRKGLGDRPYMSFMHRILPLYLIEKCLYRGTLTEAHRRQRAMTLITMGDDTWVPTTQEMDVIVGQFMAAENDPLGGWISARTSVTATDIRPGGDFWKYQDVSDQFVPYKLRALGASESFLSGDATLAAAESAYNTFMETQESYRNGLTERVFYDRIFPLVAVANDLYKDQAGMRAKNSYKDFLWNPRARANLLIPEVHWEKQLQNDKTEGLFDMLEKLDEHGFPVPIKAWLAASGADYETMMRDLEDDKMTRAAIKKLSGIDPNQQLAAGGVGGIDDLEGADFGTETDAALRAINAMTRGYAKKSVLSRQFPDGSEITAQGKTGKKKWVRDQVGAKGRLNDILLEAHKNMQDPEKRQVVAQSNRSKDKLDLRGVKTDPLGQVLSGHSDQKPMSQGLVAELQEMQARIKQKKKRFL